jgi:hypothetical protein
MRTRKKSTENPKRGLARSGISVQTAEMYYGLTVIITTPWLATGAEKFPLVTTGKSL